MLACVIDAIAPSVDVLEVSDYLNEWDLKLLSQANSRSS